MAKAYELLVSVKVDMPEWMRELRRQDEAARALAVCPRCGSLATERDIVRGTDGRVDFTASFARFECGNFYAGGDSGELGALACSLHHLGELLTEAATRLLDAFAAGLSRVARRFQRRRVARAAAGPRILAGPATVYIGPVGEDPTQEPTWCEIGHTAEGIELR